MTKQVHSKAKRVCPFGVLPPAGESTVEALSRPPGESRLFVMGLRVGDAGLLLGRYNQNSSPTREGFTGHVKDDTTHLHDAGARYYSGAFARWLGPDPILEEKRAKKLLKQDARLIVMSSYNYAFDNPTTLTDPTGLAPTDWAMLVPMHTGPQSSDLRRSIGPAPTHERTDPAAEAGPFISPVQNPQSKIRMPKSVSTPSGASRCRRAGPRSSGSARPARRRRCPRRPARGCSAGTAPAPQGATRGGSRSRPS